MKDSRKIAVGIGIFLLCVVIIVVLTYADIKIPLWESLIIIAIAFLAVIIPMLTMHTAVPEFRDKDLLLQTPFADTYVKYNSIEKLELRTYMDIGTRVKGFRLPKKKGGIFDNDEFGIYVLSVRLDRPPFIVITFKSKGQRGYVVFNMDTPEETEKVFAELKSRV